MTPGAKSPSAFRMLDPSYSVTEGSDSPVEEASTTERRTSSPLNSSIAFEDQEQQRRQAIQDQQFLQSMSPVLSPRRPTRTMGSMAENGNSNNNGGTMGTTNTGAGGTRASLSASNARPIPMQVAQFRNTRRASTDSSADSFAGEGTSALIDHRDQPHSLPKSPHPRAFHGGAGKTAIPKAKDLDNFDLDADAAKNPSTEFDSAKSDTLPQRLTASGVLGPEIYPLNYLQRRVSGHAGESPDGRLLSAPSSRRQSRAEEDVCFPVLRDRQDLVSFSPNITGVDYSPGDGVDRRHYSPLVNTNDDGVPTSSIPAQSGVGSPQWGYGFDFEALEEFAAEERLRAGAVKEDGSLDEKAGGRGYAYSNGMARQRKLSSATLGDGHLRYRRPPQGGHHHHDQSFCGAQENKTNAGPKKDGSAPHAIGMESKMTTQDRPSYRFSFYSNAMSSTIHAQTLSEITCEGQTFVELFTGRPSAKGNGGGGDPEDGVSSSTKSSGEMPTWWLDILSPTDAEMKALGKTFGIHPLTTEDILMEEAREKVELFRNYYLICFRSFDQDPYSPTYLEPLNMYIVVFREGTLSFHFSGTPHPQNVRRRIKHLKDYIDVTSDWISYAIIDDIVDAFGPLIQSIEYEVSSNDELVLIIKDADQSDMLRRIGASRRKVMGLLRLLGNKADVIKGLSKRCNEDWSVAPRSDIGLYLGDIQDHIITMVQNLNHYEKILSRALTNYLAQCQIEMTEANTKINDVLSKITAIGTILIPMNLITGLWGMNVHVPGQVGSDPDDEGYSWFFGILGVLALVAIIGGLTTYQMTRSRKKR